MNAVNMTVIGPLILLVWLPFLTLMAVYLFRRLQTRERLTAIEHGANLTFDPAADAARTRRAGIVLVAAGVGLAGAVAIVVAVMRDREAVVLLGLAIVPFTIGLGLLVDFRLQLRDAARRASPIQRNAR